MSSIEQTVVEQTVVEQTVVEKKIKSPTLSAKHLNCMTFGFWFSEQLHANEFISEEVRDVLFKQLALFAPVDEQIILYNSFLDNLKTTQKSMKKFIQVNNSEKKTRKTKPKTEKIINTNNSFVSELVSVANGSVDPVILDVNTSDADVKPVKEKVKQVKKKVKPVENIVASDTTVLPVLTEQTKPVKEKAKPAKKTKVVPIKETSTESLPGNQVVDVLPAVVDVLPEVVDVLPAVVDVLPEVVDVLPTENVKPAVTKKEKKPKKEKAVDADSEDKKRKYNKKTDIKILTVDAPAVTPPEPVKKIEEPAKVIEEPTEADDEEYESLNTIEMQIDGKVWFVSTDDNEVYDPANIDNPESVGKFDSVLNKIVFY